MSSNTTTTTIVKSLQQLVGYSGRSSIRNPNKLVLAQTSLAQTLLMIEHIFGKIKQNGQNRLSTCPLCNKKFDFCFVTWGKVVFRSDTNSNIKLHLTNPEAAFMPLTESGILGGDAVVHKMVSGFSIGHFRDAIVEQSQFWRASPKDFHICMKVVGVGRLKYFRRLGRNRKGKNVNLDVELILMQGSDDASQAQVISFCMPVDTGSTVKAQETFHLQYITHGCVSATEHIRNSFPLNERLTMRLHLQLSNMDLFLRAAKVNWKFYLPVPQEYQDALNFNGWRAFYRGKDEYLKTNRLTSVTMIAVKIISGWIDIPPEDLIFQ